jgi:superfamily II DNA/RNA helicase
MSQGSRDGVMIAFKDHRVRLLVATDIAARGLDIEHVTHVINFDVPNSSEVYVHRIGRTGRVGRTGRAITFVTPAQREEIDRIERDVKTSIGEWETPEERLEHAPRARRSRSRDERREGRARERKRERAEADSEEPADEVAERLEPEAERDEKPAEASEPEPESVEAPAASGNGAAAEDDGASPDAASREDDGDTDADRDDADDDAAESVKLFVNRGERSGISEEDLRWALREGAVLPEDAIHDVRVLHRFSFVEVDPGEAERTVEFLDGTKLKGKEIRLEVARS